MNQHRKKRRNMRKKQIQQRENIIKEKKVQNQEKI